MQGKNNKRKQQPYKTRTPKEFAEKVHPAVLPFRDHCDLQNQSEVVNSNNIVQVKNVSFYTTSKKNSIFCQSCET